MVRDRDHQAVAARTLADARKIRRAWKQYAAATQHMAEIRPCSAVWPPSLAADPLHCQLLEGHANRGGTKHRHRMLGSQATVEWQ